MFSGDFKFLGEPGKVVPNSDGFIEKSSKRLSDIQLGFDRRCLYPERKFSNILPNQNPLGNRSHDLVVQIDGLQDAFGDRDFLSRHFR